ncbi:MAG: hypothetical protein RDU20_22745 [Desulfomonilaceae bacterium]|nr:hypothetical protein [Desulfomonilaceae bacterium]
MAIVPGYKITVLRNGSPVHAKSGSVTRKSGALGLSWEISLAEPLDIDKTDAWTIRRKVAGREETLIENAAADRIVGLDGVDSSFRRVTGVHGDRTTNDLLEYCVPKTLVFVRWSWIQRIIPDAVIANGMLVHVSAASRGVRIFHPRLPGKELREGEFECIAGCDTHHACAHYLARLIGYSVEINTPDIELTDTFTVPSGTTWQAAIASNLSLWFPAIEVVGKTIFVSDVCADEPNPIQVISLTDDAIASASLTGRGTDDTFDHLIITGRRTAESEALLDEEPDMTPVKLAAIPLEADRTIETSHDFSYAAHHKTMGDYSGQFGMPGEEITRRNLKYQTQETAYHRDESQGRTRFVPLCETVRTFDEDDAEVAKTVVTYTYAAGFKPIKTVEDEHVRCRMPGTDRMELHKVRSKVTLQDLFIKPLNLSLTTEIVEGLVLYEETVQDGEVYRVDPQIFADVVRGDTSGDAIDTDPDTPQRTLAMTLNERSTYISRTHDNILIKRDQDYNRLSGHVKTQSQILENPLRDKGSIRYEDLFRKEYHAPAAGAVIHGLTCYHRPRTIHHDDITNEEIADRIAVRAFIRKNIERSDQWTLRIPVPFLPRTTAATVRLPDFTVRVNGAPVTVPGGEFLLAEATETFSFTGDSGEVRMEAETILTVRAKY